MTANIIDARYKPSCFSDFLGNPLIEALPDYMNWNNRAIVQSLSSGCADIVNPVPTASRRQKDAWLDGLTSKLFIPLIRHLRLQEIVDICIRQGYANNRPSTAEDIRRINEAYERLQKGEQLAVKFDNNASPMLSVSVTGCSGMGKTTSINRILEMYPQVNRHRNWQNREEMQIVYLMVECPHNGSVKGLCTGILSAIDACTGEDYSTIYGAKGRATVEMLRQRIAGLLSIYHVGILVIDEIQNIMSASKEREQLFNFIVGLSNGLGVPLLFVGTPKIRRFMQRDLRISRRFGTLDSL